VLPGEEIEGAPLRDGTRLKYKINGKLCWVCVYTVYSYVCKKKKAMGALQSLVTLSFMSLRGQGWVMFLWVKAHFADIALFSIFVSFFVSIWVYLRSFVGDKMLALGGNTGNPIYDVS